MRREGEREQSKEMEREERTVRREGIRRKEGKHGRAGVSHYNVVHSDNLLLISAAVTSCLENRSKHFFAYLRFTPDETKQRSIRY